MPELLPYWHKQTNEKMLFPQLEWSRPENRSLAGKLLVVGGHAQSFAAAAEGYDLSLKAGVGTARVLMPDSIRPFFLKYQGTAMQRGDFEIEFAPSTPSGSFARRALDSLLDIGAWADGALLAGDLGRNSETAIVIEQFASKYPGLLTVTKDAADYITPSPLAMLHRSNTLLVITLAQLQQIVTNAKFPAAVTFSMDLLKLVALLHEFTLQYSCHIIVKHLDNIFVAVNGEVSTTKCIASHEPEPTAVADPSDDKAATPPKPVRHIMLCDERIWRLKTAARASVWWLQNPAKPFDAITTSLVANA